MTHSQCTKLFSWSLPPLQTSSYYIYIYINIHRKLSHSGHLQNNSHWAWSPKLAAIRVSTVLYDYFHWRLLTDYFLFFVTFCIFSLFHDIYFLTCLLTCLHAYLVVCLFDCLPAYLLTYYQGGSIQRKIHIWYHW